MPRTPEAVALLTALTAALAAPAAAAAQDTTPTTAPYSHGLWLDLGLGAPSGLYGLQYQHRLPWIALGALLGRGYTGTQVGATLRTYPFDDTPLPSDLDFLNVYVELSYQFGIQDDKADQHQFPTGLWQWGHIGAGMEVRHPAGFSFMMAAGVTSLIDGPAGGGHVDLGDISLFKVIPISPLPWLRLSFGWTL